jgi:hypothetical protein
VGRHRLMCDDSLVQVVVVAVRSMLGFCFSRGSGEELQ